MSGRHQRLWKLVAWLDGAGGSDSVYALSVSLSGVDSGLNDVASGEDVLLTLSGGVVEGRTAVGPSGQAAGGNRFRDGRHRNTELHRLGDQPAPGPV